MFSNLTEEGCIKGLDERFYKKRVERLKNIDKEQIMITSDQKRFMEIQELYANKE